MTEGKGQKVCRSSLVPAFRPKILKMRDNLVNNRIKNLVVSDKTITFANDVFIVIQNILEVFKTSYNKS